MRREYDEAYIRKLKIRKLKRLVRRWLTRAFIAIAAVVCMVMVIRFFTHRDTGGEGETVQGEDAEKQDGMDWLGVLSGKKKDHAVIPSSELELPDWITVAYIPVNPYSRPGTKLDAVDAVVVHYVGNPGTTGWQNHDYYVNLATTKEAYISSNFVIGLDGTIILCVPLDEVAYASNDRNHDTISIECCHPDAGGSFTEATYQSLIKLVDWLRDTYGLSMDEVIRHYDVTGKICPKYYVENPDAWERFLKDVEKYSGN